MKVSRQQAEQNRKTVLESAAQLFRERGFAGVGVAEVMKQAGLTHGGFYASFGSKDGLVAEVCERVLDENAAYWRRNGPAPCTQADMGARLAEYLHGAYASGPGSGCLFAALGPELARQSPEIRHVVTNGVHSVVKALAESLPGEDEAQRREQALAVYASTIGALALARAVDEPELAQEILDAVVKSLSRAKPDLHSEG